MFILMAAAVLTALETKQRGLLISYNIRSVKGATDGNRSIDNNSAEPALKNFAVRRRNWLFAKSVWELLPVPLFTVLQKRYF